MVKVGSMKTKMWLGIGALIAGLACSSGDRPGAAAGPVATPAAAETAAEAAGSLLTEVRAESSPEPRLLLHTNGTPVYTSYSPQPDVYVVDLPRTAKANGLSVPTNLPSSVASVAVDDAVELGRPLTRVTLRFTEPMSPTTENEGSSVVVKLAPSQKKTEPVALAAVEAFDSPEDRPSVSEETLRNESSPTAGRVAESTPSPANVAAPEVPVVPAVAAVHKPVGRPARNLEAVETTGSGVDLRVLLRADGDLKWKTFTLKNPHRLVVDLEGVVNRVRRPRVDVNDPIVKSVRVAQFASAPKPVTRVVIDMNELIGHGAEPQGATLSIAFGDDRSADAPAARLAAAQPRAEPVSRVATANVAREEVFEPAPEAQRWTQTERVFSAQETAPPPTTMEDAPPRAGADQLTQTQSPVTSSVRTTIPTTTAVAPTPENVFLDGPRTTTNDNTVILETPQATGVTRTLAPGVERVYTGEPIDLQLKEADIRDVLRQFAQVTGLNIAIDPQVSGTVTVEFDDVPWDQALELILRQNGLAYSLDGNVMRVGTIDRLAAEQAQIRRLEEDEQLNVPLQTIIKDLSYARAAQMVPLLQRMASRRGQIQFDTRTNQVIITEIPQYLSTMLNLIDTLDIPTPQVVIEARVVETTKTFARSLGVNWGFSGSLDPALGTGTGLTFPSTVGVIGGPFNLEAGNPILALTLSNVLGTFDLDLTLTAAENEGLVRIVSAPRILAQDNEAAEIQSGIQIPIQTRVNQTTTVTYIDATLRLSVTPQITAEDTVIMEVTVQKSEPLEGINVTGGQNAPLSTRRATTKLMVSDGGTAVIGGIYQSTENDQNNRIPFLGDLPVVGNLFRSRVVSQRHDELLIFITPRIVRLR